MKKNILMPICVIVLSLIILAGYSIVDHARTDRDAPQIEITGDEISLSILDSQDALLQGVTASDRQDGDVTDLLVIESVYGVTEDNRATVTYAAFDKAGNVAKAQRLVHYTDYQSPRFTLSGPLAFDFSDNFDVMAVIGAEDVFDGDLQRRIKSTLLTEATSVTEEGSHLVQFRVTNSLGDTVQVELPVEVYPSGSYNAELLLTDYLIYLPQGSSFRWDSYLMSFQTDDYSLDLPASADVDIKLQTKGTVNTQVPGIYPVSYTAVYTDGNRTYTGYTKLIVIVEG